MSRLDSKTIIDKFLDSSDWRVTEKIDVPDIPSIRGGSDRCE